MSVSNRHRRRRAPLASIRRALGRLQAQGRGQRAEGPVDIVLVDDRTIAGLAARYRGSPRPTDVLAFRYGDEDLAGEVVVSIDTAVRQAEERGVPLAHELILLCVHGLLHLAGQGDETEDEWRRMRRAEFETMVKILSVHECISA